MLRRYKKEREKFLIYEAILTAYDEATFQIGTMKKRSSIRQKRYPENGPVTEKCRRICLSAQCIECKYYGHFAYNFMEANNAQSGNRLE
jgi:hypothetical protein